MGQEGFELPSLPACQPHSLAPCTLYREPYLPDTQTTKCFFEFSSFRAFALKKSLGSWHARRLEGDQPMKLEG
jgi:hypothetical protein